MDKLTLGLPSMYADHHVTEVRRLLSEIDGVHDVYASSAFQVVEVEFDPARITADGLTAALADAGYSDVPAIPVEQKFTPTGDAPDGRFFRHTAAYANVGNTVSFAQYVNYSGRPLWPCPGMGVVKVDALKEDTADD